MFSLWNARCYNSIQLSEVYAANHLAIFPSRMICSNSRPTSSLKPTLPTFTFAHATTACSCHRSNTLDEVATNRIARLKVERFYQPELHCSFPDVRHPEYESIREAVFSWLLGWAGPQSEQHRNWLLQSDMPGLVCRILPESPRKDRLILLGKLCLWISCLDDIADNPELEEADINGFGQLKDLIEKAIVGEDFSIDQLRRQDIKAMSAVFTLMRQDTSPRLYKRFMEGIKSFLLSSNSQIDERGSNLLPDVSTYIAKRRKTFALDYIEAIMEYGMGVELDDETLQMETVKELQTAAIDYIAWTNDLLSFRKEYLKGDLNNLLPVVYFQNFRQGAKSHDFQEAVDEVCEMIQSRERDFIRLLHHMSLSDVALRKPEFRSYLKTLPYLLSGHLEWYYSSARFHGVDHSVTKFRQGYFVMDPNKTIVMPRSALITM